MAAKLLSLLLSCGVVAVADGGLPCTVYPDAIFSPDGEWIYYIQSEMSGSNRVPLKTEPVPGEGWLKEHIDREVITIRRMNAETEKDEFVKSIPTPPWVGTTYLTTDCGDYRYGSLSFDANGELHSEFYGPSIRPKAAWQESVVEDELVVYRDRDGAWTKTPWKSLYQRPQGNKSCGHLELMAYDGEWWWLVDRQNRTFKVILAGSKPVRKFATNFTYEKILTLTQPRAQVN